MLDDESGGPLADATRLDYGLAGAVLVELALLERIAIEPAKRPANGVVRVIGPATDVRCSMPPSLASPRSRARQWLWCHQVGRGRGTCSGSVTDGLVARGVLREQKARVLGIFPTRRWPAVDSTEEDAVRRRLRQVWSRTDPRRPHRRTGVAAVGHRASTQVVGAPDRAAREQVSSGPPRSPRVTGPVRPSAAPFRQPRPRPRPRSSRRRRPPRPPPAEGRPVGRERAG